MNNRSSTSPDDLRAERARHRINLWDLSKHMGNISPQMLSYYLNGRYKMPDGMAERIRQAIEEMAVVGPMEDLHDRRQYLPRLETAALAVRSLPPEWLDDRNVQAVLVKLTTAIPTLKGLN